jgi:sugar lactone lactonase YvrE
MADVRRPDGEHSGAYPPTPKGRNRKERAMLASSNTRKPDHGERVAPLAVSPDPGAPPRGPANTGTGQRRRGTTQRLGMALGVGLAGLALAIGVTGPALADTGYVLERQWGGYGSGDGQFGSLGPQDIATDAAGDVYVVDTLNHRIQKFSPPGNFITKWGSQGTGNGQFASPEGVATDAAGNVYVADRGNHRIQKFSPAGNFITKWGSLGTGDGEFNGPVALAADASGNVYVVDHREDANHVITGHRIQKFSSSGDFITKWSNSLPNVPSGLATDASGNVYVGDGETGLIVKFTSNGDYVTDWDSHSPGCSVPTCTGTSDVATDSSGAVYATECVTRAEPTPDGLFSFVLVDSVRKFAPSGTPHRRVGHR